LTRAIFRLCVPRRNTTGVRLPAREVRAHANRFVQFLDAHDPDSE
jgi:hypothetical protein